MERRINRGQQGDIGEASAIEWLTRMGAVVLTPIGRSPDFDLVAYVNGRLLRIQVKTSTQQLTTPTGETRSAVTLATSGGNQSPKYAEFEIDPAEPIEDLVYVSEGSIESSAAAGEYPSGQRTATVNRQAQPSQVRILPPPFRSRPGFPTSKYERSRGQGGEAVINQKRRVTIPQVACTEAGLQEDDRLLVRSEGDGRVVLERAEPPPASLASVA